MPIQCRLADPVEYDKLETLVIDSFEPITWFKNVDERFGPLNGKDWRERWRARMAKVFETEKVLVGEVEGDIVAFASGTIDAETSLGFIDLLAVDRRFQSKGYGREMLRGMLRYMKEQGAVHANLDCLTTNTRGNEIYKSEGFEEVARSIRWFIKIP